MARLDSAPSSSAITAKQQFSAVAWLRWRLFVNGFRRKGGVGELAARIFVYPIFALILLGPVAGSGAGAWAAIRNGHPELLAAIFWGVTLLQVVISINISPPALSFDPESLIRFPLSFPRYLTVRLFLGLLSASTIAGTLALLSAALGITVALPKLALIAFAAAFCLAVANMLFIRMIFAWIDRWLSTRRARELFTGLIVAFSIGVQYINVTFNGVGRHTTRAQQAAKVATVRHAYHAAQPLLAHLPPGLASGSIVDVLRGNSAVAALSVVGVLIFAALFLSVFAWRMHREYRGESLSEAATASRPPSVTSPVSHPLTTSTTSPALPQANLSPRSTFGLSDPVVACLRKEWIYVRRNTAQFYGLVAPVAMVVLFAGRLGALARTGYNFPAAEAYSLLGVAALAYNSLGLDAAGVQFYFLAPIRFRSVILAKNIFGFLLAAVQTVLVLLVISFTSGLPTPSILIATLAWLVFATSINVTIGNMRSITAPKKMDPSKISRKQASQLSALMSVGLMLVAAALGFGLLKLGAYLRLPWVPVGILLVLAAAGLFAYLKGLGRIDALALGHRETLIEELSKAGI